MNIQPIPAKYGVGFFTNSPVEAPGYNYQKVGLYHNYYVTPKAYKWPVAQVQGFAVIDGFSPNLNKYLHCGHLKNLAVASALSKIAGNGKAVAMLGATLGIIEGALEQYHEWCDLAQYHPDIYFDTDLPKPLKTFLVAGKGEKNGTLTTASGVVIYKSDATTTYAAHDLSFAALVMPSHYLTGAEQKQHFADLGLGDKHKPLGLLVGPDGKKMASSSGESISAKELFHQVLDCLDETPEPKKLAWNILAWQFNSGSVAGSTKFNANQWAKPESPGLYITYTYAKMMSALKNAGDGDEKLIDQQDAEILGTAEYFTHYFNKSVTEMEPCHLAQFALMLAKKLANVYNKAPITGGKPGFIFACKTATATLAKCMKLLGMYPLTTV
jgi:arginyl-tRNA synthetase